MFLAPKKPNPPAPASTGPAKLDGMQQKRWMESRTAFLWAQPAFADIWYALMVDDNGEQAFFTDKFHTAATDGRYLYLHPEGFLGRPLDERVFILGHEVLHAVLDHPRLFMRLRKQGKVKYPNGEELPWDEDTAQASADMLINDMLINAKVGGKPEDATHDPRKVNENMSFFDAYRAVYKSKPRRGEGDKPGKEPGNGEPQEGAGGNDGQPEGKPKPGQGKPPTGSFDNHIEPGSESGQSPEEAAAARNDAEWQTGVAAAMESARLRGKLPGNIERLFLKVMEPEIDWTEKVRTTLSRRLGNSGSSWNTLDEHLIHRGIGAPGRVAYGAGYIVVAWDTSGSMTQDDMDRGASETKGIIGDVRPRRLTVMQCDMRVTEAFDCDDEDDLMRRKIKGGGGTDFKPVFDWIDKEGERPDALIYFTDTQGSFPAQEPDYPVIWVSLIPGQSVPWGDLIYAPIKK